MKYPWVHCRTIVARLVLVATICAPCARTLVAESPATGKANSACTSPEYHQFDFWLGNWDVFNYGDPKTLIARAVIQGALDSCVITEDFKSLRGSEGRSLSAYDAYRKRWQQSWVSNRPQVLVLTGHARAGTMTLSGHEATATGSQQVRGVWIKTNDGVRETAFISRDNGGTWKLWFDLVFKPHLAQ